MGQIDINIENEIRSIKEKYKISDTKDIKKILKILNVTIEYTKVPSSYIYKYKVIYLNKDLNKYQQRFVIAEFLMHFFQDADTDINSHKKYLFACELLMPTKEFIAQVHKHTEFETKIVDIEALCKYFKASQQQILGRGNYIGIFENA